MKNKSAFWTLLITQVICVLFLFPWTLFLGLSTMMFDQPASVHNGTVLTIFFTIMAYPVGLIVGIVTSWVCYARRKYRSAYLFTCIPLLWLIPIVVLWGYVLLT